MKSSLGSRLRAHLSFLRRTDGSVTEKTLRSGVWVGMSNAVLRVLEFARSIVLARLLFPEDFGLMGIVLVVLQGLETFSQTGFAAAIIHRKENVREALDVTWSFGILRGVALGAIALAAAGPAARFYDEPALEAMIRVIAVVFLIRGFLNSHAITLQKDLDFGPLMIYRTASTFIGIVVVVVLAFILRNVWALVIGEIVIAVLETASTYLVTRLRPRFSLSLRMLGELFRYGKFITGFAIALYLTTNLDNALVGKVLGMAALGYYVLAYRLANLPATHITAVVSRVMFPAYSKFQTDPEALQRAYLKVLRLVASVTIPAAVGLALVAPELTRTVYGEKWLPMVGALQVLCLFGALRSVGATTGPVFNAVGKPHVGFYLISAKLVLIVALIYPLTVRYGIVGTSWAVTGPMVLENAVLWLLLSRQLGCPVATILRALLPAAAASGLMALAVYGLRVALGESTGQALLLLILSLSGAAAYAVLLRLLDRGVYQEVRHHFRTIFPGRSAG